MFMWLAIGAVLAALVATLPLRWAAGIVVGCLPLSGTAVAIVGADPIVLPLVVTVGFAARHAISLLSRPLREQFLALVSNHLLFVAFAGYCVVSGLVFPTLFSGETTVIPQTGRAVLLGPAQTSIVQIVYFLLGLYLCFALRQVMLRRGLEFVVAAVLVQISLFGGFALIQALLGLANIPLSTSWIVNNHAYALLTQVSLGGFARVTSVFVEASSYAGWATSALAFCYGLYVNRVMPALTFGLLILLGVTMILSTSSTAYGGLLIVGVSATAFALFDSNRARHERGLIVVLIGAVAAVVALVLAYSAQDGLLAGLRDMIEEMTIRKSQSASGAERAQWAQSALQNAFDTGFLGAGYGAVRSSGMIHQLIGSVGAPGLVLFVLAMAPLARRTFRKPRTGADAVVSAGAFALCCTIGVLAVAGNDLSLAMMFWVYAALAGAPIVSRAAMRTRQQESQAKAVESSA